MSKAKFEGMSEEDLTKLGNDCIKDANSVAEIRTSLAEAGFNTEKVIIKTQGACGMLIQAFVIVHEDNFSLCLSI
jgi:predicted secreted protein